MTANAFPWVEVAVAAPLFFAGPVALLRNPWLATRAAVVGCALAFVAAALAWATRTTGGAVDFGSPFRLDELSGPLLPTVALVHLLTAVATSRRKAPEFAPARFLIAFALRLAVVACPTPAALIALLAADAIPPFFDLLARGRPTRLYALYASSFGALLVAGQACAGAGFPSVAATLFVLAALVRGGVFPFHSWVPSLFANGSLTAALLATTPLVGAYAAVRLVVPIAPPGLLAVMSVLSLVGAVASAGMAIVQTDVRRFVAHVVVSLGSLVFVGLDVHTPESTTGALALWFSLMPAATGLGVVVRAVEDRWGRLPLTGHHGLADRVPFLAVGFLLAGLSCVGFPGTVGFVAGELILDGTIAANPAVGVGLILVTALNGIALMRAYGSLFTGSRTAGAPSLPVTRGERAAILVLIALLFAGGLAPQPGLDARHRAAEALLLPNAGGNP